ncbi:MAG: hypothetical protein CMJ49_12040 [Planctomycetaceae bacterium]|nr:hypothetical protein [Planctomycetaceae bacterium]
MKLQSYVAAELTWVMDGAGSCEALLAELAERIAQTVGGDAAALLAALTARERQRPTSTPEGVAFPHAIAEGVTESHVAVVLLGEAVEFDTVRHERCDVVFVLVGPPDAGWLHVRTLARLARICHAGGADRLRLATDDADLYRLLIEEDQRHV